MIQLPVTLFRFGMFTFIWYTWRDEKICSGLAPGGSAAKFGGPVRSGRSSTVAFGSGRFTAATDFEKLRSRPSPSPETVALGLGFPPLMLTPISLLPPPPKSAAAPDASVALVGAVPVPAGTPGCFPSGDMETRAAKFPCGTVTAGAGGAGAAERAIRVLEGPPAMLLLAAVTSGGGTTSP